MEGPIRKGSWRKVFLVLLFVVTFVGLGYVGRQAVKGRRVNRKLDFMVQYIPRPHAQYLLKYTKKYNLHWLKTFAILMSESDGKEDARNERTRCKGYMQLAPITSGYLRSVLRKTIENTDIYNPEYNIAGGCLFLRMILDNFTGDWLKAIEIYNVGYGSYRDRGRRNPKYVKKWGIKYTEYNILY